MAKTAQKKRTASLDTLVDGHLLAVDSERVQAQVARECPARFATFVGGTPDVVAAWAAAGVVAPGDVTGQARRVMENLVTALAAAGATLHDVAKSTVYVASGDRADLVAAWDVVRAAFGGHDAPSTLLGVAVLGYPDQLVEVEAVAVLPA